LSRRVGVGREPSGQTRVAALIGNPARHSLSPRLHNAAFAATGLDWTFVVFEPAPDAGAAGVEAMRALGLGGLSVTMPFKEQVAAAVDELSPAAAALSAVNCVRWDQDRLVGENTDGAGFIGALAAEHGFDPGGRRCAVVGAGGAGRSVVAALAAAGAAEVLVVNRTRAKAEAAVALAGAVGRVAEPAAVRDADLVVNATSLGMRPGDPLPLPVDGLRPGQVVADLIYHPAVTPLLDAAASAGATAVNGLGMLVHQAAAAFTHWTGTPAPIGAMRDAVTVDLA
jgi:shikimate dehydrogenase